MCDLRISFKLKLVKIYMSHFLSLSQVLVQLLTELEHELIFQIKFITYQNQSDLSMCMSSTK